ncbi:glycosyltransferase [Umezawaea beigongshangensis]|uniref:glycosyltransferase n=1 Tax=Umezawaea beigongshangensis TaxID=2780383 RepID=UPI0018F12629|nr:glycosyltransferase [Umezawaea beigongshangensis]
MTWVAVALAAVGAVCFALAARMQHHAVRSTGTPRPGVLLRHRGWLAGVVLLVVGSGLHAVALGLAPLTVVQPVGVLAIGVTALLGGRSGDLLPVVVTTAGVGGFVLFAAGSATSTPVEPDAELLAGLIVAGLVAACGLLAALARGARTRALAFAAAGGVAYGYVSVLMRAVSQDFQQGRAGWHLVLSGAGIVVALAVGSWFVQHSYAAGPPHLAVACLTVVDPLVAVGIGAGLLGEASRTSGWTAAAELACAAAAVAGVVALARRQHGTTPVVAATGSAVLAPLVVSSFTTGSENPVNRTTPSTGALRIVVAADTFPPDVNGAARFAHRLAAGLAGRGHDVHVVCAQAPGAERTTVVDGVTVHRLRSYRTPFHPTFRICPPWTASAEVRRLFDELRPDLVHVQAHFLVGRVALRHAVADGVPVVATNHFMPENLFGHVRVPRWLRSTAARLAWRDLNRVYGQARVVTAPTPRAVQLLHDSGFPGTAVPVSCGIDVDRYRTHRVSSGGSAPALPTALFVGRLDEEKRVDELLRALAMVRGVRAEIVGDGSCRAEWELLARELGVADRVRFRGFVGEEELLDAYTRCDLFVMPGVAELQSLATMEAMAAGKPVIAADAMALPHLVEPGRNGWLFPPGDVTALARRLSALAQDETARARMGAASSDIIAGHTIAATLDTFESLYAGALGRSTTATALAA